MVGWHHKLDGHEFEQAPGVGGGQGSLVCCGPWGRKETDTSERWNSNDSRNRRQQIHLRKPARVAFTCALRKAVYRLLTVEAQKAWHCAAPEARKCISKRRVSIPRLRSWSNNSQSQSHRFNRNHVFIMVSPACCLQCILMNQ